MTGCKGQGTPSSLLPYSFLWWEGIESIYSEVINWKSLVLRWKFNPQMSDHVLPVGNILKGQTRQGNMNQCQEKAEKVEPDTSTVRLLFLKTLKRSSFSSSSQF